MNYPTVQARSRKDLSRAPMFSMLVAHPRLKPWLKEGEWDVFHFGALPTDEVQQRAVQKGLPVVAAAEPERDDEGAPSGSSDDDAALSYLAKGNKLVKLPDSLGSKYYRLYVLAEDVEPRQTSPGELVHAALVAAWRQLHHLLHHAPGFPESERAETQRALDQVTTALGGAPTEGAS